MKMTTRGRLTIPKHLREQYGIKKGDEVQLIPLEDGIRIEKRTQGTHPVDQVYGTVKLKHFETVDEYIDEIRGPADPP